jgi:hypothetical protein
MPGFSRPTASLVPWTGAPQCSPLAYSGFPVDLAGVGGLHAAFLNESRTRECWWRPVQEIRIRGRKRRAKPFKRSLCTKPLERISEKTSPQKKNPEGYGLQPVRKCIHRGPALAAERRIFPSIQRHHEKNTPHTLILFLAPYTRTALASAGASFYASAPAWLEALEKEAAYQGA